MELGQNATPFEHRSFGDELNRCLRYYRTSNIGDPDGSLNGEHQGLLLTQQKRLSVMSFVPMRATPTVTLCDNAGNTARVTGCGQETTETLLCKFAEQNRVCKFFIHRTDNRGWISRGR